ncbi:hypothetical protein PLICRDRAFT_43416 [Plicaturopsis crispa FD-325 SS-3]|nr:hypothetical protein PLICRDRAFT_43416 [Plicaturopsis crispa FD-325 SS-3]
MSILDSHQTGPKLVRNFPFAVLCESPSPSPPTMVSCTAPMRLPRSVLANSLDAGAALHTMMVY